jgi:hypothetical protein
MARELSDWLDAYVEYTEHGEAREAFRLWSAISSIAGCLQRKCYLNWGMLTYYPNMYVVLIGPPASRKGTAMTPGLKIIREVGIRIAPNATTREALIRELAESSVNREVLEVTTTTHASLSVFSTEFTVFLGYKNMQLMTDLCTWYDCEDEFVYRTKHGGTDIVSGVFLNIVAATTPDLLQLSLPLEAVGSGLTSRIVFIYEPGPGPKKVFPFQDEKLYQTLIRDLNRIRTLSGQFKVSGDFMDAYAEWYMNTEQQVFQNTKFEGYCARRATHILKLVQIVAASRSDKLIVTAADLQRAVSILESAEKNMEKTFSGVGKSKLADVTDKVLTYLAANRQVTMSALLNVFYRDADHTTLYEIVRTLQVMNCVEINRQESSDPLIIFKGKEI